MFWREEDGGGGGEEEEEEKELVEYDSDFEDGPNFRFFREKRFSQLDDTEISFRATQDHIAKP